MDTTTSSPASSPLISSTRYRGLGVMIAVGATAWLATFGAGIASADTGAMTQTRTLQVSYNDLKLDTTSGAQTLLVRINKAAKAACGPLSHSPLLPREVANHRDCVTQAVDAAVKRVDLPTLTALHTGSAGGMSVAAR